MERQAKFDRTGEPQLGIPTVKDMVVQCAVKRIIEPIFEVDFHDCSFGFRPNGLAQQEVDRIAVEIRSGKRQVYDADLSSYFDTIPYDKLFLALRMRITDSDVLRVSACGGHYLTGKKHLEWCPSNKSVRRFTGKSRKRRCGVNCFWP